MKKSQIFFLVYPSAPSAATPCCLADSAASYSRSVHRVLFFPHTVWRKLAHDVANVSRLFYPSWSSQRAETTGLITMIGNSGILLKKVKIVFGQHEITHIRGSCSVARCPASIENSAHLYLSVMSQK